MKALKEMPQNRYHLILKGDAKDKLRDLPNDSVDCIVTSPPYFRQRNYDEATTVWDGNIDCIHRINENNDYCMRCGGKRQQLGDEDDFEFYILHLMQITKELKRILKPTGVLFWNMSDSYAGSGGANRAKLREGQLPYNGSGRQNGIENKSLMLLPERFAISMVNEDWILRNKIIWWKRSCLPTSATDRLTNRWEYVYFFTKSRQYYFNLNAIRKPYAESTIHGVSLKRGYNGQARKNYRDASAQNPSDVKRRIIKSIQKYGGANPGDIFDVQPEPHLFNHFAAYPYKLVETLLKAGCPVGGTVLDPFAGSGTTGIAAERLNLNSILVEISPKYIQLIKERMNWGNLLLGEDITWEEV